MDAAPQPVLRKLLLPLLLSVVLGCVIFYSNDAYQLMGLAALQHTIVVFGYALGIAEFLTLALLLQRVVQLIILDRIIARALGAPVPRLLSQMSSVIIYAIALAAIIGVVFKKDLTVVAATFGGASIVVGLALQGMIRDLFAGLTINLDRSINIGDFVCINKSQNIEGEVRQISWRTTQIVDSKGNLIIVPNNQMSSTVITNYSAPAPYFEVEIIVTLDVAIPVDRALPILQTAATEAMPLFSPANAPPPAVRVRAITLQGVEYQIIFFPTFKTRTRSRNFVHQHVLRHLHYAGLLPAREKCDQYEPPAEIAAGRDAADTLMAQLLGATPLFQDLTPAELQWLADASRRRHVPVAAVVSHGGELVDFMFLVMEGLLVAEPWRKRVGAQSAPAAIVLGPGSLVNGTELLVGGTGSATIRAKTPAVLCEIRYPVIEQFFVRQPKAGRYLSRRIAEQLSDDLAQGRPGPFQLDNAADLDELSALVFKNLRRTFAHLQLA